MILWKAFQGRESEAERDKENCPIYSLNTATARTGPVSSRASIAGSHAFGLAFAFEVHWLEAGALAGSRGQHFITDTTTWSEHITNCFFACP